MSESQALVRHKPVLVDEVITYLHLQPNKVYLDVTFGSGGHTRALLEKEKKCRVIALDWDTRAIETYALPLQEEFGDRLDVMWGNFSNLLRILKKADIKQLDGILADFGTSQIQIMERPGFSIYRNAPLDMRMSPSHQRVTAVHVLEKSSEKKLAEIFFQLGEERHARKIARAIVEARARKPITTTTELAQLVTRVVPFNPRKKIHPATQVFQALRIYVNHELDNIISFIKAALTVLAPQGRLVCISFHSLEDRLVKNMFKEAEGAGIVTLLTKKVVTGTPEEIKANPSARSAKLRAVMKI
jgi:16S rRNA (cytosine1402-N4)-methyltransferase